MIYHDVFLDILVSFIIHCLSWYAQKKLKHPIIYSFHLVSIPRPKGKEPFQMLAYTPEIELRKKHVVEIPNQFLRVPCSQQQIACDTNSTHNQAWQLNILLILFIS